MYFSIIVPVYNAERTLNRCLKSIELQEFKDFEVILVDDGSRDQSYSLCEAFVKKDSRFKLIHQENQGPSSARNLGLKAAQGLYVCFIDSDDYVSGDYLSHLHDRTMEKAADAVFFGFYKVNHLGSVSETRLPPVGFTGISQLYELSKKDMFGYTWIKCFLRKTIGDVCFPKDMSLFEDEVFCCQVLKKAARIDILPEALYYYVDTGADMLTRRIHDDYCVLSDRVFSAWEKLLQEKPGGERFLEQKANSFTSRCIYYGMEQNVNIRHFFNSLRQTSFFNKHIKRNRQDRYIEHQQWHFLEVSRLYYRLKLKIVLIFGKHRQE